MKKKKYNIITMLLNSCSCHLTVYFSATPHVQSKVKLFFNLLSTSVIDKSGGLPRLKKIKIVTVNKSTNNLTVCYFIFFPTSTADLITMWVNYNLDTLNSYVMQYNCEHSIGATLNHMATKICLIHGILSIYKFTCVHSFTCTTWLFEEQTFYSLSLSLSLSFFSFSLF